jgi:hypothetical protein
MLELFDRFNAHVLSHKNNEIQLDAKIISLKEAVGSSHVNQTYGTHVADGDKRANIDSLSLM